MTDARPQLAPDFEDRHLFALELCQHLGLDSGQVKLGSLVVELGEDNRHTVRWDGVATITTDQLATLANQADAKADAR